MWQHMKIDSGVRLRYEQNTPNATYWFVTLVNASASHFCAAAYPMMPGITAAIMFINIAIRVMAVVLVEEKKSPQQCQLETARPFRVKDLHGTTACFRVYRVGQFLLTFCVDVLN